MISVTALATACWLIPYGPNTDDPVSIAARIEVVATRGLTGRQTRRPTAFILRHTMSWRCKMKPAEFAAARKAALAVQAEPVLVPFWPGATAKGAAPVLTTGLTIAWIKGWQFWTFDTESDLSVYDATAPVLWGRLKQPPRLVARTNDSVTAEFSFVEEGPVAAAILPPEHVDATFATADGLAAPVFPFAPDPAAGANVGLGTVDTEYQPLGAGRRPTLVFYPQLPEQALEASIKFRSAAEALALLGWWQRRRGGAAAFWVASTQSIGRLSGDLAAGTATVPTVGALKVNVGESIAILTTGQPAEFARVTAVGASTLTLAADTAAAHSARWSWIVPAILARHTDDELALDFRRAGTGWIADAPLSFREVAPEVAPPEGETRGTTLGALPAYAWLFRIDLDYSGATESWYLTDWEDGAITPDDQAWEYRDCNYSKLVQSIDLEDDSLTFTIGWWPGCPWENWLPGKLSATGKLTILRSTVSDAGELGEPVVRWTGELGQPQRDGPLLSVQCLGANALFSRLGPRQQVSKSCYKRFCGGRCKLDRADWMFSGVVTAVAGAVVTVGTWTRDNAAALPAGFGAKDWFALGWVQWVDAGGRIRRAEVLSQAAIAGGAIVFTLARPLGAAAGDAIKASPECDRLGATCRNKFANYPNFGGFEFVPAVDPKFIIPQTNKTPAKK